jgi:hypothetical protein
MVPGHLASFLTTAKVDMHPVLLVFLAQLYLPESITAFLSKLSPCDVTGPVSAKQIADALLAAVQQLDRQAGQQGPAPAFAARQCLEEEGLEELLGPMAVATRFGLIERRHQTRTTAKGPHGRAAGGGQPLKGTHVQEDTVSTGKIGHVELLLQLLPQRWSVPANALELEQHLSRVEYILHGCAAMESQHVRRHVLWKLALLYLRQPDLEVALVADSAPVSLWARTSPDSTLVGLDSGPQRSKFGPKAVTTHTANIKTVWELIPAVQPDLLCTWAWLFAKALKPSGAVKRATLADVGAFQVAARTIEFNQCGYPPPLSKVIQLASDMRAGGASRSS